ncbi:hypothetical protein FEM03_12275 [Phragmitibacter flavus]|uniref:Uncharacterized protein n=1 Tax=Phragmitibacter flavus TaxID=2576071 RepID=A0A5R8KET0_9BACT|nr:hypothetical protein [Phragmitibacter flavus]TLD70495.1 hypothetical protein FEM03_12275 [Phragmitibacter flavus]
MSKLKEKQPPIEPVEGTVDRGPDFVAIVALGCSLGAVYPTMGSIPLAIAGVLIAHLGSKRNEDRRWRALAKRVSWYVVVILVLMLLMAWFRGSAR